MSETHIGPKTGTSLDEEEIRKFSALADEWWDPEGAFRPLHKMTPFRLGFLHDSLTEHFSDQKKTPDPLRGLRLLDIGCGGGLLSEPMKRLGARVTGVDASAQNIGAAQAHARSQNLAIDYRHTTIEDLVGQGEPAFDIILNMEVVEHVADPSLFLQNCARLLAPGGIMVISTINRTMKAFLLAILGAEYILGWLPRGTHRFDKLVKPEEIRQALQGTGISCAPPVGACYTPLLDRWSLGQDTHVNYFMLATRPDTRKGKVQEKAPELPSPNLTT